jgi:hypothetical protein
MLRPPIDEGGVGYRLDLAIGTTYSLDLIALLAAPVAMAFADWQDREGRPVLDPLALLKALRQYADRICLFCQTGKIYVPKNYQPLLVNLEASIVQAAAPQGGSFHPKLWVLRFTHPDDPNDVVYRVLCLSRNLTFDRAWDTLLALEGPLKQRSNAIKRNHPLGQFVESLSGMANPSLSPKWSARIEQIAREVRRVEFETPSPFSDFAFVPLGIENHTKWPFPDEMSRLLVIAPFVDDGCVKDLAWHETPMELVSRAESLALLSQERISAFQKVWTLDESAEPDPGEAEQTSGADAAASVAQEIPLAGLHAKLYVGDYGHYASVWTGSANATKTAFERNVEFLIELQGKRSVCGVEAVLGKRNEAGPKKAGSIADMLQPYVEHLAASAEQLATIQFEQFVDRFAKSLLAANPVANCEPSESPETFRVEIVASGNLPNVTMGTHLRAWPVSMHESQSRPLANSATTWCTFEPISIDAVTSFFVIELQSADATLVRRFVVNLPLVNAPEHRSERILKNLLNSPQKLMRFLLMLLLDQGTSNLGGILEVADEETQGKQQRFEFLESTLLESLLRALDRDPSRIDQVASVIEDLLQTPDGRSLLPDNFDSIWQPIWSVRKRQLAPVPKSAADTINASTKPSSTSGSNL